MAKDDLLSRFIPATTGDAGEVDYKHLRDMILNIIMAGKDTTAGALAWFLYMMCKHPEVQERISEEAADAGEATSSIDDFSRSLNDEALNKMHYLHAALPEPPATAPDFTGGSRRRRRFSFDWFGFLIKT